MSSIADQIPGSTVAEAGARAAVASAPAITLPAAGDRELRLDLFRGLALWLIFVDHLPPNILTWFTIRNYGFSDATGRRQEVRGEGVVGEQPVLAPGERFEYTSGVPLPTASGFMTGRYQMVSESGERFEIDVPTFSLDSPDSKRVLN